MLNQVKPYDIRRQKDNLDEKGLQKHFDSVYNILGIRIDRTPEKYMQIQGCDLIMYGNKKGYIVDEKAAAKYIDFDLQTYTFELSFKRHMKSGQWENTKGWFHDKNKTNKTEFYALGYVRAPYANDNFNIINRFEVILVSKQKLWNYIHSLGYKSADEIVELFESSKKQFSNGKYFVQLKDNIKLIHSSYYEESPLNIQIQKTKLTQLASAHVVIEQGLVKIHKGISS